jgi:hypothetical protein
VKTPVIEKARRHGISEEGERRLACMIVTREGGVMRKVVGEIVKEVARRAARKAARGVL